MEYVQLVVPQHLYDELGLQPSQTITLSRSQNVVSEPATHDSSVSTAASLEENSSQHHEPFLTDPEFDNPTEEEARTSFHDKELLAIVKEGNGKQKLLTYQLKSTTLLSNSSTELDNESTSDSSDDVDAPTGKLCAVNFDASVPEEPKSPKTVEAMNVLSPYESHAVFQGKSVNASFAEVERVKHLNPMFCEICSRGYLSKASFRNHRKHCEHYAKNKCKKVVYPRRCADCERTYADSSAFSRHKGKCEEFKMKQAKRRARGEPCLEKREKIIYPWYCITCSRECKNPDAYRYHKKKCYQNANVKSENNSYPRTCATCHQIYFCSSSYSKHKQLCGLFEEKQVNVEGLESNSQLSNLKTLCQVDAYESDAIVSNSLCDIDEWEKIQSSVSVGEKPGKWIPICTDKRNSLKYFVVKKTTSLPTK